MWHSRECDVGKMIAAPCQHFLIVLPVCAPEFEPMLWITAAHDRAKQKPGTGNGAWHVVEVEEQQ